jgi:hypothetical protein
VGRVDEPIDLYQKVLADGEGIQAQAIRLPRRCAATLTTPVARMR